MLCLVSLTAKYAYYMELKAQTAQDIEVKGDAFSKFKASERVVTFFYDGNCCQSYDDRSVLY